MRTTIAIIILCFTGFQFLQAQNKYEYKSDEAKAFIVFPGKYEVKEENKDFGKSVTVTANANGMVFMFNYVVHNTTLTNQDELSAVALESFSEALGGKVKKTYPYKYNEYVGKRAVIYLKKDKANVNYVSLICGQVQYQMVVIVSKGTNADEAVSDFFHSLIISK